jgi:hypothetical protein
LNKLIGHVLLALFCVLTVVFWLFTALGVGVLLAELTAALPEEFLQFAKTAAKVLLQEAPF